MRKEDRVIVPRRFHDGLEEYVDRNPNKIALVIEHTAVNFIELARRANDFTHMMAAAGVGNGDRISIYAPLSIDAIAFTWAAMKRGCIITSMHYLFSKKRLCYQLVHAEVAILLTDRIDSKSIQDLGGPLMRCLFQLNGLSVLIRNHFNRYKQDTDHCNPIRAIFYTSGSSGAPKGVVIRNSAMCAAQQAVTGYLGLGSQDIVLSFTAPGSDFGFYNVFIPLNVGATAVVRTTPFETPESIHTYFKEWGITGLHVLPASLHQFAEPGQSVVSSLRYICSTGQAFPTQLLPSLKAWFPNAEVFSSFGLTECKRVAFLPPAELAEAPGSIGYPIPSVRTYILDEARQQVAAPGVVGELAIAGDLLLDSYWNDSENTARTILSDIFGESRLLLTGDLFRRDEKGRLWFVGRRDEVFTRSGLQVDPREIERVALSHVAVRDAVVVPFDDPIAGKVPNLFIVQEPASACSANEIMAYCRSRLEWHMHPAQIIFVSSFPQTVSGKIAVRELSRLYGGQTAGRQDETTPLLSRISSNETGSVEFKDSVMKKLGSAFADLANGKIQVPRRSVTSRIDPSFVGAERAAYQEKLMQDAGPLFMHFMASIPCIQEELARVGCAIAQLVRDEETNDPRPRTYFELDAFDGSQARALVVASGGKARTLTSSPNPMNASYFHRFANVQCSHYIAKSFLEVKHPHSVFLGSYDFIYEMAAFQFYGPCREQQIRHVVRLLRPDGIAFFLEKMNHPDPNEYQLREFIKDRIFKTRYFSEDEIKWKHENFLKDMENGQVTLDEFLHIAHKHFSAVTVIWHSTNFYEIVASNDAQRLQKFLDCLGPIAIEPVFDSAEVTFPQNIAPQDTVL